MDGWTEEDKGKAKRMRWATPPTSILNLVPQFSRELIGYTVLSARSNANLRASVQSETEIERSVVNDLLNASFHVLFLALLSVLSPIAALLVLRLLVWKSRGCKASSDFKTFTPSWPPQALWGIRGMMSWTKFERGSSACLPNRLPLAPKKINLCLRRCYTPYSFSALLRVGSSVNWKSHDGKGPRGEAQPFTAP